MRRALRAQKPQPRRSSRTRPAQRRRLPEFLRLGRLSERPRLLHSPRWPRSLWTPRLPQGFWSAGCRRIAFVVLAGASVQAGISSHDAVAIRVADAIPSWFALAQVRVAGLETVADLELRRLVGLPRGAPRAAIEPAEIEARLSAHPQITQAQVSDAIPGLLLVRIVELRPVARVRGGNPEGGEWWVDHTGMPFRPLAGAASPNLPLLMTREILTVGTRSAGLASALGAMQGLLAAGVAVAEWHVDGLDDGEQAAPAPVVHLEGGAPPLVLGSGDPVAQVQSLARALALGQVREAGAIDLRFRDQVIFWPASPDVGAAGKRVVPDG